MENCQKGETKEKYFRFIIVYYSRIIEKNDRNLQLNNDLLS